MKQPRAILLVLTFLVATLAYAQDAQEYRFADVAWLSAPQTVIDQLAAEGYSATDSSPNENNAIRFSGTLLNKDTLVYAFFDDQDQLIKTVVYLITGQAVPRASKFSNAEETYIDLKTRLTDRYGEPAFTQEEFIDPYFRGDGYETQAVEQDKAEFTSGWFNDEAGSGGLVLQIDNDVDVAVIYESSFWNAYLEQQQEEDTDVF